MHAEILSERRDASGNLRVEVLWLLTDAEVEQFIRTGLARLGTNRHRLTEVRHIFSPARVATRSQRIVRDDRGNLRHASGIWLPPDIAHDDARLWRWAVSGLDQPVWERAGGGGSVPAFPFVPTKFAGGRGASEFLDPQWVREIVSRVPDPEIRGIVDWKGALLDRQLRRGEPIRVIQRTIYAGQIGASADDAEEADNGSSFSSTTITNNMTADGFSFLRWNSGHRFTNVPFAQGSVANACTVEVWPFSASTDDAAVDLGFEDVDDAVDFVTNPDVTSRVVTTAVTPWNQDALGGGGFATSPDFAPSVDEVFARPGWLAGNDVAFIGSGQASTAKDLRGTAYDADAARATKLNIDVTEPGPGPGPTPGPATVLPDCPMDFTVDGVVMGHQPFGLRLVSPEPRVQRTVAGLWLGARREGRRVVVQWGEEFCSAATLDEIDRIFGVTNPAHTIAWNEPDGSAVSVDIVVERLRSVFDQGAPGFYDPVILTMWERP